MFKTKRLSEKEILLSISGSMTGEAVGLFEKALDTLQSSAYQIITLDLSGVSDVSSLFIGHVLHCHKRLSVQNRSVRISGCNDSVRQILEMLNVHNTIQVEKDPPQFGTRQGSL